MPKTDRNAKRDRWTLILAFAVVYLVWGSTYLGIRYAIATIPPLIMAGTRFMLAGLLLLAWSWWRGYGRPRLIHWRSAAILGFLMLLGGNGSVTFAEQHISSGLAALLVTSEPLWLVLLAWLRPRGTAPTPREFCGLALGFLGVVFLVAPADLSANTSVDIWGAVLVLSGAFTWAAGSIYSTRAELAPPILSNGMTMLCGGAFLLLSGILSGETSQLHVANISAVSLAAFLYLIVFGSLAAFSAYTYLLAHTTPSKASSYAFVNPVVAVLLGWAIGGEIFTVRSLIAMVAIVSAVVLLTVKTPHQAQEMREPVLVGQKST